MEPGLKRAAWLKTAYFWGRFWLVFFLWTIWKGAFQVVEHLHLWLRWTVSLGITAAFCALFLPVALRLKNYVLLVVAEDQDADERRIQAERLAAIQADVEAEEKRLKKVQAATKKAKEKQKAVQDLLNMARELDE